MKSIHKKNRTITNVLITIILIAILVGSVALAYLFFNQKNDDASTESKRETNEITEQIENEQIIKEEEEPEEKFTNIRISAAGDIMFHNPQIIGGYDETTQTYNFKPYFENVAPILTEAHLAIANFEATLGGPEKGYSGYPLFNAPDEVVDAIKFAGIDVVSTANNHSLDTGSDGLKRTVKTFNDNGIDTVGTYAEKPNSRVLLKNIEGIKIAILSYTESTNGLGDQYPPDLLNNMLNLMVKDRILNDIEDAKNLEADFIIAFMHWGTEYMEEPNQTQIEFSQMMAEAGVDLILGSHPHVIQKSEVIKTNEHETFVIYSLGNFISNQRKETLGDHRELTEDGLILNIDIEKNHQTNETTIDNVEYIPTWVYRDLKNGSSNQYTYRILPISDFLLSDEISNEYKKRMERSYEATMAKMIENPF